MQSRQQGTSHCGLRQHPSTHKQTNKLNTRHTQIGVKHDHRGSLAKLVAAMGRVESMSEMPVHAEGEEGAGGEKKGERLQQLLAAPWCCLPAAARVQQLLAAP